MHVAEIWRYPVKSMGGERLDQCELTVEGIPGDRAVHVEKLSGKVITSRTRPRLLLHRVRLGPDGEPLVDGRPWRDPAVLAEVIDDVGQEAKLIRWDPSQRPDARFDIRPLLVATDGAIAALGVDFRRLRPNLIIGGVEGLAERSWEGRSLHIGDVVISVVDLRQRCVMTTFDPDTAEQTLDVLIQINQRFDSLMALNCEVVSPGRIRIGDRVEVQ